MNYSQLLSHAVTAFDRKQFDANKRDARKYYNVYALPQYLGRVADVVADIKNGANVQAAICAGFTPGPLRNACLRACGLAVTNVESHGSLKGLPVYQPVKGN